MKDFEKNGFFIIKGLISELEAKDLESIIVKQLELYANQIECSYDQYLYCTGRWANPSKINHLIPNKINELINQTLQSKLEQNLSFKKSNIIGKCEFLHDEVPFHQDISYSYDAPYSLSVWLALNDVPQDAGPLQVIPGSHIWPISPAVDFWSPDFIDEKRTYKYYSEKILELVLEAGDAIVFSSRLWHGSKESYTQKNRFAYVSRWINLNEIFPDIPKPQFSNFGMWTCDKVTYKILLEYLNKIPYTAGSLKLDSNIDYLDLLDRWITVLSINGNNMGLNVEQAIMDINNLITLKKAAIYHNAGDLVGKIYKNLWYSLLKFLSCQ